MAVPGTFEWLLGSWTVEREIDDRRAGVRGRFSGTATLILAGDEANYLEEGVLSFGAHAGAAERHLRYGRGEGGRIEMRFADGGRYLTVDLADGACTAVHPCAEDSYEITVRIRSESSFEERWRVRGPAKDYDAVAVFERTG